MAYDNIYDEKVTRLVPAGEYDCILSAEERQNTFTQEIELNLCFKIRRGLGQTSEGALVFSAVKHDKNFPDEYNHVVISSILNTTGERKSFKDNDELIQYLNGLALIAPVYVEPANQYHQNDKNKINFFKLKPSQIPLTDAEKAEIGLRAATSGVAASQPTTNIPANELSDEDLPF